MSTSNTLICVVGATASGKTKLAIEIAQFFNTEIVSFDSRQVYQELNIGVARPEPEELQSVKHHLIATQSIHQPYTAAAFALDFRKSLKSIFEKKNIAVAVGGTGLYLNAGLGLLDSFPSISKETRDKVNQWLQTKGLFYLQNYLKEIDPIGYSNLSIENPRRISKAIEVFVESGKPYSSFLNRSSTENDFNIIKIGIHQEREVLYKRIDTRVDRMMEKGLLSEVHNLYEFRNLTSLKTVGYSELFEYLDGKYDLNFAIEKIKQHTRNYAKRQITWWKKDEVYFFDSKYTPVKVFSFLKEKIAKNE